MNPRKRKSDEEAVLTEGEKHLQNLVKNQLKTDISLNEQFSKHRSFTSSGRSSVASKSLRGVSRLEHYEEILQQDGDIDELRSCGLTDKEIKLKLDVQSREKTRGYGINPSVHKEKMKEIEQMIEKKKDLLRSTETSLSGAKEVGRHELELEHSLTGEETNARVLSQIALKPRTVKGDPLDPINNLSGILRDVTKNTCKTKVKVHCTKQQQLADLRFNLQDSDRILIGPLLPEEGESNKDLCVDDRGKIAANDCGGTEQGTQTADTRKSGCQQVLGGNVESVPEDVFRGNIESVPEEVIKKYRYKVEDIRTLPRFEHYERGEPSNVLYLKNMSGKVTKEDLVSLFGRFEKLGSRITYRLMTGRMRGQAFVTFPDKDTAILAAELVNGYQFRGKPIIIQFGKT